MVYDEIYFDEFNCINDQFSDNDGVEYMQFTGLHDRNGKEVYCGDILAFDKKEWGSNEDYIFEVEQSKTGEWIGAGICTEWETYCEVIGNIYESPELLEQNNG